MNFSELYFLFILFIALSFASCAKPLADESKVLSKLLPEVPTFADIARKNGFKCEEYNVTTDDGYILGLFRIPGNASRPVFLIHGILDCSDALIIRGNISHALTLARNGYDVWAGNNRGTRYSRRHVSLNPDTDADFWNYSFHEMGTLDLPVMIDFILKTTGQSQLRAVGHSEGTTIFYVLGSTKPEYNSKISVFVSLAPIAFLDNTKRGIVPALLALAPKVNVLLEEINYQEVVGFNSSIKSLLRWICEIPVTGYDLCYKAAISLLIGPDFIQIKDDFFPTLIDHYPAGTSKKSLMHYSQVGRRKSFAQYDYGTDRNLKMYGSSTPPEYNLTQVTFDVVLYVGVNDYLSTVEDVAILRKKLPNVVDYQVIPYLLWNHFDFLFAEDLPKYLSPLILDLFDKY